MFCGLQGVSRSFEARKRDAVTVSLTVSISQNIRRGATLRACCLKLAT
jgi:hypothetical protein